MVLRTLSFLCLLFLGVNFAAYAQKTATLKGRVTDAESNKPIESISISLRGTSTATYSDSAGFYSLTVPADKELIIVVNGISFKPKTIRKTLVEGSIEVLDFPLESNSKYLKGVDIEDRQTRASTLTRLNPKLVATLPTSGGVESLLKTLPGVSSNNEMSSQYNVRGGNYDENLIYVNDVEIYRPFLVRSGQQEGLSFINPDLVSSILFSAGGFDAKYGDKMSSVLDIQYRRPREFTSTITGSLLGGAIHLEGKSKSSRFTYLLGIRQRSNQYLLKSLDTQGDYRPLFADGQILLNYDFTPEFSLQFLGNYARNKYNVIPTTRETTFGTVNQALRLTVYFDGQEINDFETMLGAFTGIYKPNEDLTLKFITSGFRSYEFETFDVQGQYYIDELETDFSKDNFGDVKFNRGIGTFLNHARNYLTATVINAEHKGYYKNWLWGLKLQGEMIEDKLSEWQNIDSAGYSIPQSNPELLELSVVTKQKINLNSNRITNYLQYNTTWGEKVSYTLTAGVRSNYWTLNKQLVVSPRTTFSIQPDWKKDWLFRFSAGMYYQPPFYRELRDFQGNINSNLKAQQSIHFVAGADHNFFIWKRPFKITTEIYYKQLNNLVPYEIDNVRIRYYAQNLATGYATGIDTRIYGEFVNGIESWFSLSVMKTAENLRNDSYTLYYNSDGDIIYPGYTANSVKTDSATFQPGFIPRPSDQRVNFGIFFQDYIPRFPMFKMNLSLLLGTGMPFGPPSFERYKDTLRMPPYRRVDIGFSYQLVSEEKTKEKGKTWNFLRSAWLSVEVFNLLQVNNTISYLWLKDVTNRQYAIPNYLTNRQLNVKLIIKM
jgi:hypothetical protein